MLQKVFWNDEALPQRKTLAQVLYEIRHDDADDELLLDSVNREDVLFDIDCLLDATLDALETVFSKLERRMQILQQVMNRSSANLQVLNVQITPPFKRQGTAQVAVIFELSDLQTVTIFFHNPDADPKRLAPTDTLLSWKWLLNKKDVTIVVAPEKGQDLNVREVARRIMKLAEKNSAAFARANAKKEERAKKISDLQSGAEEKIKQLESLEKELEQILKETAEAKTQIETLKQEVEKTKDKAATVEKERAEKARKEAEALQAQKAQAAKQWMDDHIQVVGAGAESVKKAIEEKLGIGESTLDEHGSAVLTAMPTHEDPTLRRINVGARGSADKSNSNPADTGKQGIEETEPPKASNAEQLANLINQAYEKGKDVTNAFKRPDMDAPIDIVVGDASKGLKHIVAQREKDGTNSILSREEQFNILAEVLETGALSLQAEANGSQRLEVKRGESSVILAKNPNENAWILTGWAISKEKLKQLKELPPGERRSAYFNSAPTHVSPTISRTNEGAGGSADKSNSNPADAGRQGIEETEPPKAKNAEELTNLLIEAIDQKKDIPNAFKREDMDGPIDIKYSVFNEKGELSAGLAHILESRSKDGTLDFITKEELFKDMALAIEKGEKAIISSKPENYRVKLSLGERETIILKKDSENAYILTGWNISKERLEELKSKRSGEQGAAFFNPPPTHDDPTISRIKVGADNGNSNTVDTEKQEAISYLNSVIDGSLPTLVENSTGDKLEELYNKYREDSELEALIVRAIDEWGHAVYEYTNKQSV